MDTDGWLTNRQLSRAPSAYDVKARWVTSYVYELPFGKGKRFLNRRGVVDGIIGGWQLSGIFTLQSGLSYTVSVSGDPANVGQSSDRPDRLASGITSQRTLERWFDPNAFVAPGDTELPPAQRKDYHHGNSGRDILYADGREGWDSGLFKNFRITENHKLEFRFEAFNLPNHPDFNAPSASLISTKVPGKTTADLNPNLGRVSSAAAPRILQMALRYVF